MANKRNVLVVAERSGSDLSPSVYEMLTLAQLLVAARSGEIAVVLLGDCTPDLANGLSARGASCVLYAPAPDLDELPAEARLPALVEACARISPNVVLLAHDLIGAELAPRLAFRVGGAAATGCIEVDYSDRGSLLCTRPCHGGLAREVIEYGCAPVVATLRAGVYAPAAADAQREARVHALPALTLASSQLRVVERESEPNEGIRLEDARVIVAGGRGLEGPGGFDVLRDLAAELGAAVGASRVPCDLGWCPHSWQIGLTGKTVTPELYFAVGISGAGHHMAGCGNAKTIVAINTDPDAAIFQDARFGIVGDYREIVPALVAEIRRLKQAT